MFNQELLMVGGLQAWLQVFEDARAEQRQPDIQATYFVCPSLYELIPDVPAAPVDDTEASTGQLVTRQFCQQVRLQAGCTSQ